MVLLLRIEENVYALSFTRADHDATMTTTATEGFRGRRVEMSAWLPAASGPVREKVCLWWWHTWVGADKGRMISPLKHIDGYLSRSAHCTHHTTSRQTTEPCGSPRPGGCIMKPLERGHERPGRTAEGMFSPPAMRPFFRARGIHGSSFGTAVRPQAAFTSYVGVEPEPVGVLLLALNLPNKATAPNTKPAKLGGFGVWGGLLPKSHTESVAGVSLDCYAQASQPPSLIGEESSWRETLDAPRPTAQYGKHTAIHNAAPGGGNFA